MDMKFEVAVVTVSGVRHDADGLFRRGRGQTHPSSLEGSGWFVAEIVAKASGR